jgi:pimeloyl-ACP methyl ester carboxylesterase
VLTKTVILVHGAWADGSSWAKVIPLLVAEGLAVTAIQMPLTSFADDTDCLRRALVLADSSPVVLVGHSYGGAVITEVGTGEKVSGLVYIAAFAPDAGESSGSLGQTVEPAPMSAELRPDSNGFLKLTEAGIRDGFAQDLSKEEQEILFAAQAPTAAAALGGIISKPAWRSKPSWYLVASEDRAIQPGLERMMARRMGAEVLQVSSSHVAMLSQPKATAGLILQAARSI